MSKRTYTTRAAEALGADALAELALDLRWSFNHAADEIWQALDPELWDRTHNPWFVLQTVSRERLAMVTSDAGFRHRVADLVREKRQAGKSPVWFHQAHSRASLKAVAYFSMEYMLSDALPIYSGGLGNVAGDQLKTATNLGIPVTGVGLLYQQGYFRQEIDLQGRQRALYPFNDPGQLPIRPLRDKSGEWVRLSIPFPGSPLWLRAWQARIGGVRLYLLDANDPANTPAHRGITSELYGGDAELRLKQELVLGIGGWRVLRAAGLHPDVCHLNEGHAAFVVLERAREFMAAHTTSFEVALTVTRAGNLFTTHTPVDAGFDRFEPGMLSAYLGAYAEQGLGIPFRELLALGRQDPDASTEPFNMAYLAIRGSRAINGVSRLHAGVSRRLFGPLFPRWPEVEVPVAHVTNGVHTPTWDSAEADRLWESACGKNRWRSELEGVEPDFRCVTDAELWQLRSTSRARLVQFVRARLARQRAEQGASAADVTRAASALDPEALTIGFARRFASYKRPNLLLHDPNRLARILTNTRRPVQLVVAGKAHPQDATGQALVTRWVAFMQRPDVAGRAVFLSDYDMLMAERLVQGIDLWINTPRRPLEACGTSGMKVLVNGGLNLSELDGWWAEAYSPEVGWAIGDGRDRPEDPSWDAAEAEMVYALLDGEISSAFYERDDHGIPLGWVARMRESMARLTPRFSANRSMREYTNTLYVPAAAAYRERAANAGRLGADLVAWRKALEAHWASARFSSVEVETRDEQHVFRVLIDLGALDPESVRMELYADAQDGDGPLKVVMTRVEAANEPAGRFLYVGGVPASRPVGDFTPRLVPHHPAAVIPLEARAILWYARHG